MNKKRKKSRLLALLKGLAFVAVLLVVVAFFGFRYLRNAIEIHITVEPQETSMLQDEEIPDIKWDVSINNDAFRSLPLNRKGYTVGKLLDDMKHGKYQDTSYEVDVTKEGEYDVTASLNSDYENLPNEFGWKIKTDIYDGAIVVKNKVGEWDGNKFKKWDGSYVTNDFVTYQSNVYYFKDNGEMATGFETIGDQIYYFDENGVRGSGWISFQGNWYHATADGIVQFGWQDIDDKTYYFDSNGCLVTGQMRIGSTLCTFDDDGALISKEYSVNPDLPMIAITFDDGPGKDTDRLLDVLEQYHAHATFFMVGSNASAYPSTIQRMKSLGCELGNHTWSHPQLTTLSAEGIQDEVGRTNNAIAAAVGVGASVLRPPYGDYNSSVLAAAGLPAILWSVDTLDWKTKDKDKTVEAILSAKDGDIVLLHDIHSWSVDAAIEAIPKLIDAGYQLVTVSEMGDVRNGGLSAGHSYAEFK